MRRGFTLLELLVAVAVVGALVAVLLPAVQKARGAAARAACQNNLRQVGLALHAHHDAAGRFPPGYVSAAEAKIDDAPPGWGWAAYTLPHLGEGPLFAALDFTQPVWDPANAAAVATAVPVLRCPADRPPAGPVAVGPRTKYARLRAVAAELAPANYVGSFGVGEPGIDGDGLFFRNSRVRLGEVADGTGCTFLAGERSWPYSETVWAGVVAGAGFAPPAGSPVPVQVDEAASFVLGHTGEMWDGAAVPAEVNSYSSQHYRSSNYLFCDGHVKVLTAATGYALLKALSTRAGGEVIPGEPE